MDSGGTGKGGTGLPAVIAPARAAAGPSRPGGGFAPWRRGAARAASDLMAGLRRRAGPGIALQIAEGRGRLLPLAPVMLSLGIALWFRLPGDPGPLFSAGVGAALVSGLVGARLLPEDLRPLGLALALAAGGFLLAALRTDAVAAPVLGYRYYGPIEGRVVDIDRSWSDRLRVTLDEVRLDDLRPERTPRLVRLALHAEAEAFRPAPGQRLRLTGHLAPPEGPVAPGAFDFRRLAWFDGLGAIGYTRRPVEVLAPAEAGAAGLGAHRARILLSRGMQARIPGQPGAFAAALMTGDRSGLDAGTNAAMRAANLSHMISISGLHMGLLAGFVFAALRRGLALVPAVALRWPTKKIAAGVALIAATGYLWLAGPEVPTERAWIMAAVMLVAVMLDKRAVTLRSVALAALVLLVARPESLVEPGFQMSFAATVALILGWRPWQAISPRLPWLLRPVLGLAFSSLLAGTATAPVAAAHFNRIAEYGLLANTLTVPVMGALVMPAGVIAGVAAPFGLQGPPLWAMGLGCRWILWVAQWVAGLEGAVLPVPAPGAAVLPLLALGATGLLAARGGARLAAAALVVAGALGWAGQGRPPVLVTADGALVGILGPEGRALSKPAGAGFAAASWLEDDGDAADQPTAAARPGPDGGPAFQGGDGWRETALGGVRIVALSGKRGTARLAEACAGGGIVVLAAERPDGVATGDCDLWDLRRLRWSGALAISLARAPGDGPAGGGAAAAEILTVRDVTGWRAWTR